MNTLPPLKVECKLRFNRAPHGRKELTATQLDETEPVPSGRVPRIAPSARST